jgi:hypothetical protein
MDHVDIKSYDHCGYAVDMDLILLQYILGHHYNIYKLS